VSEHKRKNGGQQEDIGQIDAPSPELTTGSNAPDVASRTLEQALGTQVRSLRRQLDLTVSDLAAAAAISIGMLSKIENGQISPSLATLQAIASALNVPITTR
jgi:DNA-binding XRE family transcriptional regulator